MRLHHAGIATRDVDALAERFAALLDGAVVHEETLEAMCVVFVELDTVMQNLGEVYGPEF